MELLNQADGNVMTMLAGINEEVDDEALKEEIMRCFLNAPTIFQTTQVMREQKKLLKKMHLNYGPHSLREAFDMTLEFKKEYQITQPQSTFNIMEMCYEETPEQEEFSMEEVQMRSQMQGQGQGQYKQGNHPQYQKRQYNNNGGQKPYQRNNYRTKATNHSISKDKSKIKAIIPKI